jgi:hypothetical protein
MVLFTEMEVIDEGISRLLGFGQVVVSLTPARRHLDSGIHSGRFAARSRDGRSVGGIVGGEATERSPASDSIPLDLSKAQGRLRSQGPNVYRLFARRPCLPLHEAT